MASKVGSIARTAMDEVSAKGAFVRTESQFRNWIRKGSRFPPASGRYHLIVSYACPWASRCLFLRSWKGLEKAIGVTVVDPVFVKTSSDPADSHHGWQFYEPLLGCKTVRDFYEKHSKGTAKFTVPILFDMEQKEIVSNESSDIIRMLGSEFDEWATLNVNETLYSDATAKQIDEVNEWVYPMINNGVYRSGFATTQEAYSEAVKEVFEGLDRVEDILSKQRYIASTDKITEADVRLFVTLVRFDEVYHGHFKCNKKLLQQYDNITNYIREIYQIPGIAETVNMEHIRNHYMRSHPTINPLGIVSIGPNIIEDFVKSHNRDQLFPTQK